MKEYLEIRSFGGIDVQAFTLIGASTKRNDSTKIGLYGSGNKYSIATLLKQEIDFKVFSGEDEIKFTTRNQQFRDQNFNVILVNGQETSLTTTMGGDEWNTAFAPIREIYSNALDEDADATLNKVSSFVPEKGYTKFFIELTEEVKHFYDNVHLYFCNQNPKVLFSNTHGSMFTNTDIENVRIFRKGILSHFSNRKKALLHYNLENLDINESRVIKYTWQIDERLGALWKTCTKEELISTLLLRLNGGNSGYLEHEVEWGVSTNFSDSWHNVCKDKKFAPVEFLDMFDDKELEGAYKLPMKLLKELKSTFEDINVLGISSKNNGSYVIVKPNQILIDKVIDAMGKLNSTQYKHRFDEPIIKYVKFSSVNVRGLAENGEIYLSVRLDVSGVDEIAKIIIEENEHNLSGYGDETRAFQDHLFNLYYSELTK